MARLEQHEKDCEERLGKPFTEVHRFLDQYAEKYPVTIFEEQHRQYLHNQTGIEKVREMWGDEAAKAAMLHIARDDFGCIPAKFKIG